MKLGDSVILTDLLNFYVLKKMNYFSIFVDSHHAKVFLINFFYGPQYSTISLPLKKTFFSLDEGNVIFQKRCVDL